MTKDIKTLKIGKNSITISPKTGLYINNLILGGVEISKNYFDEENKRRGGIFAMIPNSGPGSEKSEIPQHGFVRISSGEFLDNQDKNIISQKIIFFQEKNKTYPYSYEVINNNILSEKENKIKIEFIIKNLGNKKMPISIGFHPYFIVKDSLKKNIIWNFSEKENISKNFLLWKNGGTYFFENLENEYNFFIPEIGNIKMNFSENFKRLWLRTPKGGNSVCFEPNMNDYFGLTKNPSFIKKGEQETFFMEISLEK